MTAFTVSAARFISRRTFARAKLIIATILCIVMIGSLFLVGIRAQSDAATLTVDLPAEHAAALIDAYQIWDNPSLTDRSGKPRRRKTP